MIVRAVILMTNDKHANKSEREEIKMNKVKVVQRVREI